MDINDIVVKNFELGLKDRLLKRWQSEFEKKQFAKMLATEIADALATTHEVGFSEVKNCKDGKHKVSLVEKGGYNV